jgi:hypothetical protein
MGIGNPELTAVNAGAVVKVKSLPAVVPAEFEATNSK